jgi:hypothetical protein
VTHQLKAAALRYAAKGWHVFPLVPDSKVPAVKNWERRATTDADRIERCWSAGAFNIGIACGPSGLVVVDLDRPKPGQERPAEWARPGVWDGTDVLAALCEGLGEDFPVLTYAVHTGRGGTHLYYRHPQVGEPLRNSAGALGWLIDTRAHGGYVVAAGSIVDGRRYWVAWGEDHDPAPLPGWIAQRLAPAALPPQEPVCVPVGADRRGRYLETAIRGQLDHLSRTPAGQRNQALYHSAVALGQLVAGGALDEQETTGLLTQAALKAGLRPAETRRTIASGLRAGAKRPRTVNA